MRLLFDEMLSDKLPHMLDDIYPGFRACWGCRVTDTSPDAVIWEYAKSFDYIVTTKDTDFLDLSRRLGSPPKLLLIRIKNAPNRVLASALRQHYRRLLEFSKDRSSGVYELV